MLSCWENFLFFFDWLTSICFPSRLCIYRKSESWGPLLYLFHSWHQKGEAAFSYIQANDFKKTFLAMLFEGRSFGCDPLTQRGSLTPWPCPIHDSTGVASPNRVELPKKGWIGECSGYLWIVLLRCTFRPNCILTWGCWQMECSSVTRGQDWVQWCQIPLNSVTKTEHVSKIISQLTLQTSSKSIPRKKHDY